MNENPIWSKHSLRLPREMLDLISSPTTLDGLTLTVQFMCLVFFSTQPSLSHSPHIIASSHHNNKVLARYESRLICHRLQHIAQELCRSEVFHTIFIYVGFKIYIQTLLKTHKLNGAHANFESNIVCKLWNREMESPFWVFFQSAIHPHYIT